MARMSLVAVTIAAPAHKQSQILNARTIGARDRGSKATELEEAYKMRMDGLQPEIGAGPQGGGFFAGFTFKGDQDLDELASFYGLTLPALVPTSLGDYLRRIHHGIPRPGYRVAVGCAELCVLEVEEGVVTRVGLRPLPFPPRRIRRSPERYQIGRTLFHAGAECAGIPAARMSQVQ